MNTPTSSDLEEKEAVVDTTQRDMPRTRVDLGCTAHRHAQIGVHAVVNARGGLQSLNSQSLDDIELIRDSRNIRDWQSSQIRFYQFNSRFCRKHQRKLQHLLSNYND